MDFVIHFDSLLYGNGAESCRCVQLTRASTFRQRSRQVIKLEFFGISFVSSESTSLSVKHVPCFCYLSYFFFVLISIFFMLARLKHQRLLQPCHHSPLSYFYFRLYHSGFTLLSTSNSFKPLFPFIKIHRFVYKNKYIHIVSIFIRGVIQK